VEFTYLGKNQFRSSGKNMSIPVRNKLVQDLLNYLDRKAGQGDQEADALHAELLADQTEATYEEMKEAGELPVNRTKGGSWIV
jgi:hypothetical protein